MIKYYLWIGLGGMIGTSLRYALGQFFLLQKNSFPWDTLIVNLLGAFVLALIVFSVQVKEKIPKSIYPMLTVGILGSFTTFSTIMLETVILFQDKWSLALLYMMTTFLGGIFLSALAYFIMKTVDRKRGI